jgi:hypothetical protein
MLLYIRVALCQYLLNRLRNLYFYKTFNYGFYYSTKVGFLILAIKDSNFNAIYTKLSYKHFY